MTTAPPTPAGWYPDPTRDGRERYWDGHEWTSHVRVKGAMPGWYPDPTTSGQDRYWNGHEWTGAVKKSDPVTEAEMNQRRAAAAAAGLATVTAADPAALDHRAETAPDLPADRETKRSLPGILRPKRRRLMASLAVLAFFPVGLFALRESRVVARELRRGDAWSARRSSRATFVYSLMAFACGALVWTAVALVVRGFDGDTSAASTSTDDPTVTPVVDGDPTDGTPPTVVVVPSWGDDRDDPRADLDAVAACVDRFDTIGGLPAGTDRFPALTDAAIVCDTLSNWMAAAAQHPDALQGADPLVVAGNVCTFPANADRLADLALCGQVPAPTTTTVPGDDTTTTTADAGSPASGA